MSYDKNGIMPECSKCGSPICEHLRESTLLEENARLREIVRKQTATLKDYFRPADFTASGYEAKFKAAIKLGEGI